jgi:ABC-type enterochelin transport system substrate-binding protein
MSYCRFQNTSEDLQDCIDALDNYGEDIPEDEDGLTNLSKDERRAAEDIRQQCETYIRIFDEAEEAEEDLRKYKKQINNEF